MANSYEEIDRRVGINARLAWYFNNSSDGSGKDEILTGRNFILELKNQDGNETVVNGSLFPGDSSVYFDLPESITSVEGEYKFYVSETKADGTLLDILSGELTYTDW